MQNHDVFLLDLNQEILICYSIHSRDIFLLSKKSLERLGSCRDFLLDKAKEEKMSADSASKIMFLLEHHFESPKDYVHLPLIRIAEDVFFFEMRKFRGSRFTSKLIRKWMDR